MVVHLALEFVLTLILLCPAFGQWCYEPSNCGPDSAQWNGDCKTAVSQSPINIDPDNTTTLKVKGKVPHQLRFSHKFFDLTAFTVFNTGNFVAFRQTPQDPKVSKIQVKGYGFKSTYGFFAMRFHWSAEHLIKGRRFPLEVQIIFKTRDAAQVPAYVVVTFVPGKESKALAPLVAVLPNIVRPNAQTDMPAGFNISSLLPKEWNIFRYTGTATTPPCEKGTIWSIFTQRMTASDDQINAFHKVQLTGGAKSNARPVQPKYTRERKTILYIPIERERMIRDSFITDP